MPEEYWKLLIISTDQEEAGGQEGKVHSAVEIAVDSEDEAVHPASVIIHCCNIRIGQEEAG